jgi:hypothetical protein
MNRWRIPAWLEQEIIERDKTCVYCGSDFAVGFVARRSRPSWEHIINDATIISRENIARCCIGCNASKGTKSLASWLGSRYCKERGINLESIAPVVRASLESVGSQSSPDAQPADPADVRLVASLLAGRG